MLELWKVRRARKAATAAIAPYLAASRQRLGGIPDRVWLHPFVLGFMAMLITLEAEQTLGADATDSLALVQAEAWGELTGLDQALVGPAALDLSAAGDADFAAGCANGGAFARGLRGAASVSAEAPSAAWLDTSPAAAVDDRAGLDGLWMRNFDEHVIPLL